MPRAHRRKTSPAKPSARGAKGTHGRPIWNGHLVFGLVSMPVRIHPALDVSERVGFRLLHRKDRAPITYKKFCSREDVEVPADEIIRGYEVAKGEVTAVEGEELDEVQAELGEGQHTIDVMQFVAHEALDPLLFERPYFVVPNEGGEKAYTLLRDALRDAGQVGIVRLYLRRAVLAAIWPRGEVLALEVMRPFEELRAIEHGAIPAVRASDGEKRMARKLIEEMTAEWDPRAHPDRYRATLEKLLAGRPRFALDDGGEVAEAKDGKGDGKVVDLMEALRRSLGGGAGKTTAVSRRSPRRTVPSRRGRAAPRARARPAGETRAR